ncbi:MAG: hypothetical protein ABFR65_07550, partial [Pseudomonadota bacterium]
MLFKEAALREIETRMRFRPHRVLRDLSSPGSHAPAWEPTTVILIKECRFLLQNRGLHISCRT